MVMYFPTYAGKNPPLASNSVTMPDAKLSESVNPVASAFSGCSKWQFTNFESEPVKDEPRQPSDRHESTIVSRSSSSMVQVNIDASATEALFENVICVAEI